MTSADHRAAAHALHQHGVFTRAQLLADGVSDSTVRRRVAAGRWVAVGPSAFQFAGPPPSVEGQLTAATLSISNAYVSHLSAAVLHDMAPLPPGSGERIQLTRVGDLRTRYPGWSVRRTHTLESDDWTVVRGIRCTSPARTLIDLATDLRPKRYAEVVSRELTTRRHHQEVESALERLPGRGKTGAAQARRVLRDHLRSMVIATSELERRFLMLVDSQRLPTPASQFLPPWRSELGVGLVDFAYPPSCLLVEVDGRQWHALGLAFEADRRRDQQAIAHGWRTLRFTWAQVVYEPLDVAAIIQAAIAHPQAA